VSLKRYQDRLAGGRRSYDGFDIDGRSPTTDQRVSARPIAFRADATAMETTTTTALLPWQRQWSASRNFSTPKPVRVKSTLPQCISVSLWNQLTN